MSEQVKRQEMTLSCRQAAFCTLHSHLKEGVLERGALAKTAAMFNVNHTTMSKFWQEMKKRIADDDSRITNASDILTNLSFFESRKFNRGRHKKWDRGALRAAVWEVPLSGCKTFRRLASDVQVPKSTLHDMFKREENENGDDDDDDEDGGGGETDPYRSVRNRSYIKGHVSLCTGLSAMGYRNKSYLGLEDWNMDGPLGTLNQHSGGVRDKMPGLQCGKQDKTINKEKYRELLLEKVVPAIVKKWPRREWNNNRFIIWMQQQQDGAKLHIHPTDVEFQQALDAQGLGNKILLYTQPANSPDTNINNLGFFQALQLMYHCLEECPNDEGEIIEFVTRTYYDYDQSKINNIWLTLMACYNQIIVHHGGNDYKIPHIGY